MKFNCKCCDYSTNHEGRYNRHINSTKHHDKELDYSIGKDIDNNNDNIDNNKIVCEYCDKEFNYKSSKSTHINKLFCKKIPISVENNIMKKRKGKKRKRKERKKINKKQIN